MPLTKPPPDGQLVDYPRNESPRNPQSPAAFEDSRLLATPTSPNMSEFGSRRRSPLNPSSSTTSAATNPFSTRGQSSNASTSSRPVSRSSSTQHIFSNRQQNSSGDSDPFSPSTLSSIGLGPTGMASGMPANQRGSMILYRLADDPSTMQDPQVLQPPRMKGAARYSVASSSGDSISFADSKYPMGMSSARGLVPYAYDPLSDEMNAPDDEDALHDPKARGPVKGESSEFPWRGVVNLSVLCILCLALVGLFAIYPILTHYREADRVARINGNLRINGTGQLAVLPGMRDLIDVDTPEAARTRVGFDGMTYDLVFSDEFNQDGRTFYPGDDPYWEAVDLWYGGTADLEYYDPQQVITRNGSLVITIDAYNHTTPGVTPGSTAPFTTAENHDLEYRSGMVQTWNKFCFTRGYIEVSVLFPGDENAAGYWPGAWTMGNLARPGYPASTDGMWPYTYNSCDVGTLPNQTYVDKSGPEAALYSDRSQDRFNKELSWLSGQRVSACSCPGSDHPGPRHDVGRGSPELDIFEASRDKRNPPVGTTVSQSSQFAPFPRDYQSDESFWQNFNEPNTWSNTFKGSGVQQSVSGVSTVPSDMFQNLENPRFVTFGFEYWSDPKKPEDGYIWWQIDDKQTHRVDARQLGPDPLPLGTGVSQRLISEEPMMIILNLGMSASWQKIDVSTMTFPGEFLIDYVRVYQRRDEINVGCDPPSHPTAKYIEDHLEAYTNINMTEWKWPKPRNSFAEPC